MSTINSKQNREKKEKPKKQLISSDVLLAGFYAFLVATFVYMVAFRWDIVALAWSNAVNSFIDYYVKDRRSVWFRFLYALIITLVAIIVIYYAAKFTHQTLRFTA